MVTCEGQGRYVIFRPPVDGGQWEFAEHMAFANESLQIDTSNVSIAGMTALDANYADRLTHNYFETRKNWVKFIPTAINEQRKLTLPLLEAGKVEYILVLC